MNVCEFSNVTKRYGDRVILDRVTGAFARGEMVALIGKTGSGKSTLLNALTGVITPDYGQIMLFGEELKRKSGSTALQQLYMNKISFMFQQGNVVLEKSIEWNLRLPLIPHKLEQNQIHIKVHDVMQLVGLTQDPKEKAAHLSGGEIRKLAFARAIIKPWELLILDEPTTNLDESSAMQLMDIVANLHHENNTILIATHDPEVVKRCERTVLLRNGFMEITTNPSRI